MNAPNSLAVSTPMASQAVRTSTIQVKTSRGTSGKWKRSARLCSSSKSGPREALAQLAKRIVTIASHLGVSASGAEDHAAAGLANECLPSHAAAMFVVTEADAAANR